MKFELHQMQLNKSAVDEVNRSEKMPDWYLAFLAVKINPTQEKIDETRRMFAHVANITADDLDHAYEIGNIGPTENIKRVSYRLNISSISVGDVLVDETGAAFVVSMIGFDSVKF
jgi:hypothetical protein